MSLPLFRLVWTVFNRIGILWSLSPNQKIDEAEGSLT